MAQPNTALSPEWDRWFDETFADLVCSDVELTRDEFDALVSASWPPSGSPDVPDAARTDEEIGDSSSEGETGGGCLSGFV